MEIFSQFTVAMVIGLLIGLGIAFIFCLILVYLGIKAIRNGSSNPTDSSDSQEIT